MFPLTITSMVGAVALAFALGGTIGLIKGIDYERDQQATRVAKQAESARSRETKVARSTFRLQEVRDADQIRINDRLADALQRLRNRPTDRVPPAATPASAGSTGAELSGPDADFLERFAARADRLRSDLETCRAWAEKVTNP